MAFPDENLPPLSCETSPACFPAPRNRSPQPKRPVFAGHVRRPRSPSPPLSVDHVQSTTPLPSDDRVSEDTLSASRESAALLATTVTACPLSYHERAAPRPSRPVRLAQRVTHADTGPFDSLVRADGQDRLWTQVRLIESVAIDRLKVRRAREPLAL